MVIRDEIAGCSEKAYDYVSISDARQMLLFSSDQELLTYVNDVIFWNLFLFFHEPFDVISFNIQSYRSTRSGK